MKKIAFCIFVVICISCVLHADIWDDIRTNALAPNIGENGRALPLAAGWQTGWYKYKWGYRDGTFLTPDYIIDLIEKAASFTGKHCTS